MSMGAVTGYLTIRQGLLRHALRRTRTYVVPMAIVGLGALGGTASMEKSSNVESGAVPPLVYVAVLGLVALPLLDPRYFPLPAFPADAQWLLLAPRGAEMFIAAVFLRSAYFTGLYAAGVAIARGLTEPHLAWAALPLFVWLLSLAFLRRAAMVGLALWRQRLTHRGASLVAAAMVMGTAPLLFFDNDQGVLRSIFEWTHRPQALPLATSSSILVLAALVAAGCCLLGTRLVEPAAAAGARLDTRMRAPGGASGEAAYVAWGSWRGGKRLTGDRALGWALVAGRRREMVRAAAILLLALSSEIVALHQGYAWLPAVPLAFAIAMINTLQDNASRRPMRYFRARLPADAARQDRAVHNLRVGVRFAQFCVLWTPVALSPALTSTAKLLTLAAGLGAIHLAASVSLAMDARSPGGAFSLRFVLPVLAALLVTAPLTVPHPLSVPVALATWGLTLVASEILLRSASRVLDRDVL